MGRPRTPLALKEQVMGLNSLDTFVNNVVMMVIMLITMILLLLLMMMIMIMTKTLCYVMNDPN